MALKSKPRTAFRRQKAKLRRQKCRGSDYIAAIIKVEAMQLRYLTFDFCPTENIRIKHNQSEQASAPIRYRLRFRYRFG